MEPAKEISISYQLYYSVVIYTDAIWHEVTSCYNFKYITVVKHTEFVDALFFLDSDAFTVDHTLWYGGANKLFFIFRLFEFCSLQITKLT